MSTIVAGEEQRAKVDNFIDSVSNSKLLATRGTRTVASMTLLILRSLVDECEWKSAKDLTDLLRNEGRYILTRCIHGPFEAVIGNMIRRVLKLVRDEASTSGEENIEADSLRMSVAGKLRHDHLRPADELKLRLLDGLDEFSTELEVASEEIADQALQHIHANEVILTIGKSRTVEQFLKNAAEKGRKFQVIVAECAPHYHGQKLATSLAAAKIQTTVITDSAVFAVMSRVNKVIMGTHSIMANGGLKAVTGSHVVALAAKHYSVPLIVCASMHKLTPKYCASADDGAFSQFASPQESLNGADGKILSKIDTANPTFEYVPPELVTLFISNMSGHAPSYVYRLLSELYHPDDYEL